LLLLEILILTPEIIREKEEIVAFVEEASSKWNKE
jgi:hypothetical protein